MQEAVSYFPVGTGLKHDSPKVIIQGIVLSKWTSVIQREKKETWIYFQVSKPILLWRDFLGLEKRLVYWLMENWLLSKEKELRFNKMDI